MAVTDRMSARQRQIIAKEASYATLPGSPAWKSLAYSEYVMNDGTDGDEVVNLTGRVAASAVLTGDEWGDGSLEGRPSFIELGVHLAKLFGSPTTTTPANGVLTRQHVWLPSDEDLWAAHTYHLVRGMKGGSQKRDVFKALFLSDLGLQFERRQARLNGKVFSLKADVSGSPDPLTTPGSITDYGGRPMLGRYTKAYIDTVAGNIGTTVATTMKRVTCNWKGWNQHKWIMDGTDDPNDVLNGEPDDELTLWLARDAQGVPLITGRRAGTRYYIRVVNTGPLIESVTPDYYNLLQIDYAAEILTPGNVGEMDALYGQEFGLKPVRDETIGYPSGFKITLRNTHTAY